jgi:hypothetical protein
MAGHGDVVPAVYGPENGTRVGQVVQLMHHGDITGADARSAAANAAGVIHPSALWG